MPVLLYGVTEPVGTVLDLPPGVCGAPVQSMATGGLACFYSECSTVPAGNSREMALEFHRVVNNIFRGSDVIPFRFPTLLADRAEIASEIENHLAEYHEDFERLRGRVQMDIRICQRTPEEKGTASSANSGTVYLRARFNRHLEMRSAAEVLRSAAAHLIERWHEREYSDHLRCSALIARSAFPAVGAALAGAEIPSHLLARVSGPWPPTEFLKEESDGGA